MSKSKMKIVLGQNGRVIYLNDVLIAGKNPLKGGILLEEFWVNHADVLSALGAKRNEVLRGKWELREKAGEEYWCCSCCGRIRSEYYAKPKDEYCSKCGAKMEDK